MCEFCINGYSFFLDLEFWNGDLRVALVNADCQAGRMDDMMTTALPGYLLTALISAVDSVIDNSRQADGSTFRY